MKLFLGSQFRSGYLFGAILSKFGLVNQSTLRKMTGSTEAALHNFALIRPILEELQIKVSFLLGKKFL